MSRLVLKIKKSALLTLSLRYGMLCKGGDLPPESIRNWGGIEVYQGSLWGMEAENAR